MACTKPSACRYSTRGVTGSVSSEAIGVDASVVLTIPDVSTALTDLGFSGTASL